MGICFISSDPLVINKVIWSLWLEGTTVKKALENKDLKRFWADTPLKDVASIIDHQYGVFELVEDQLQRTKPLTGHLYLVFSKEIKEFLIYTYYTLDERVVHFLLGKKLSAKTKKELEKASARIQVPLVKCVRIFNNIKRISKLIEGAPSSYKTIIQTELYLPNTLVKEYIAIIFMCHIHMDVSYKKLSYLAPKDFQRMAEIVMSLISTPIFGNSDDFDTSLSKICKQIKSSISTNPNITSIIESEISNHLNKEYTKVITEKLSVNYRLQHFQNILALGARVINRKSLKKFITKFHEKIFEPLLARRLSSEEYFALIKAIESSLVALEKYHTDLIYYGRVLNSFIEDIHAMVITCMEAYNSNGKNSTQKH